MFVASQRLALATCTCGLTAAASVPLQAWKPRWSPAAGSTPGAGAARARDGRAAADHHH